MKYLIIILTTWLLDTLSVSAHTDLAMTVMTGNAEENQQVQVENKKAQFRVGYSEEHLVPVCGFFDVYDGRFAYYSKIRQVLFAGLSDNPEIRFQIIPSFSPECVLDIEFVRNSNKYFMNYHQCEPMLWRNLEKPEKVKVKKYRKEIKKESVDLIKSLFDVSITQVRYWEIPKGDVEFTVMADGIGYFFTLGWHGFRSGYTRSPSEGTKMKKLVDIGYELIELAKSNKKIVAIDDKLQVKIENLINELK